MGAKELPSVQRGEHLFELPIAETGRLVCTRPKDKVYLVTFTSPPDNRLVTVSIFLRLSTMGSILTGGPF